MAKNVYVFDKFTKQAGNMELADKIIVVTGGASGIGRAMCERFAREGAAHVVVADLNETGAKEVADLIGGSARRVDVSREQEIQDLIEATERDHGPIDLFCSNAGIGIGQGIDEPTEVWQTIWEVKTMSHVWAAKHLVPKNGRQRRRLSTQYCICSGSVKSDRFRHLCGHQACCGIAGRMVIDHSWR